MRWTSEHDDGTLIRTTHRRLATISAFPFPFPFPLGGGGPLPFPLPLSGGPLPGPLPGGRAQKTHHSRIVFLNRPHTCRSAARPSAHNALPKRLFTDTHHKNTFTRYNWGKCRVPTRTERKKQGGSPESLLNDRTPVGGPPNKALSQGTVFATDVRAHLRLHVQTTLYIRRDLHHTYKKRSQHVNASLGIAIWQPCRPYSQNPNPSWCNRRFQHLSMPHVHHPQKSLIWVVWESQATPRLVRRHQWSGKLSHVTCRFPSLNWYVLTVSATPRRTVPTLVCVADEGKVCVLRTRSSTPNMSRPEQVWCATR